MTEPRFPDVDERLVVEPGCTRCPALASARECIAWGTGARDADVMVVGEAPGAGAPEADRWKGGNWTGMAFTTRHSGRRLRGMFADLGYGPDELFVTNAVKCFPADGDGGSREPTAAERRACAGHLRTELDVVDPEVVVTAGKHATESVLGLAGGALDGFVDAVLEPVPCPELAVTVLPILHPSYQDVWLRRLGYDPDGYVSAIGDRIQAIG